MGEGLRKFMNVVINSTRGAGTSESWWICVRASLAAMSHVHVSSKALIWAAAGVPLVSLNRTL